MASEGGGGRRRRRRGAARRKPTTQLMMRKKKKEEEARRSVKIKKQETTIEQPPSSPAMEANDSAGSDLEGCCTPKAERFRIPEIKTCPPAPKKQRVVSSSNCSLQRPSPIAFFASPDIELFFVFSTSPSSCSPQ